MLPVKSFVIRPDSTILSSCYARHFVAKSFVINPHHNLLYCYVLCENGLWDNCKESVAPPNYHLAFHTFPMYKKHARRVFKALRVIKPQVQHSTTTDVYKCTIMHYEPLPSLPRCPTSQMPTAKGICCITSALTTLFIIDIGTIQSTILWWAIAPNSCQTSCELTSIFLGIMDIDCENSVMYYDVGCQWYNRARSIVLCKSPIFNGRRRDEWIDGEVIERMWNEYNGRIKSIATARPSNSGESETAGSQMRS